MGSDAHWTLTEVLELDHTERRRWVHEIRDLAERSVHQELWS